MAYIKEDGKIYKITKTPVDLDALKTQLADEKAMEEPTEEELIAEGRAAHPYYMRDIKGLEDKIAELEAVK